jgi:hypothetical protein
LDELIDGTSGRLWQPTDKQGDTSGDRELSVEISDLDMISPINSIIPKNEKESHDYSNFQHKLQKNNQERDTLRQTFG